MSFSYPGVPSNVDLTSAPFTITEPTDGDAANAASVNTPLSRLADLGETTRAALSLETAPASGHYTQIMRAKVATNLYARLYASTTGYLIVVGAAYDAAGGATPWTRDAGAPSGTSTRYNFGAAGWTMQYNVASSPFADSWTTWTIIDATGLGVTIGDIVATNALKGATAAITGLLTAGSATIAGALGAASAAITGALTAASGTFTGEAKANKHVCSSGAPTITFGSGAGATAPTGVTIEGSNMSGTVQFTTSATPAAGNLIFSVDFTGGNFSTAPTGHVMPGNYAAWALYLSATDASDEPEVLATGVDKVSFFAGDTALTASTQYKFRWIVG
jgi:hypothetical protein